MLKEFVSYIKSPREGLAFDYRPKPIWRSFILFLVLVPVLSLAVGLLCVSLGRLFPDLMSPKVVGHHDMPLWIMAVLGPVLEEGACRLSLVRKKGYLITSLILPTFMVVSILFYSKSIYTLDHLLPRIGIAVLAGSALYFLLGRFLLKCKFKPYFWFWAILFGCFHLLNIKWEGLLPLDYVSMFLYVGTKILKGLVLGYVRMKNSFATSTALHMINNLLSSL